MSGPNEDANSSASGPELKLSDSGRWPLVMPARAVKTHGMATKPARMALSISGLMGMTFLELAAAAPTGVGCGICAVVPSVLGFFGRPSDG